MWNLLVSTRRQVCILYPSFWLNLILKRNTWAYSPNHSLYKPLVWGRGSKLIKSNTMKATSKDGVGSSQPSPSISSNRSLYYEPGLMWLGSMQVPWSPEYFFVGCQRNPAFPVSPSRSNTVPFNTPYSLSYAWCNFIYSFVLGSMKQHRTSKAWIKATARHSSISVNCTIVPLDASVSIHKPISLWKTLLLAN